MSLGIVCVCVCVCERERERGDPIESVSNRKRKSEETI